VLLAHFPLQDRGQAAHVRLTQNAQVAGRDGVLDSPISPTDPAQIGANPDPSAPADSRDRALAAAGSARYSAGRPVQSSRRRDETPSRRRARRRTAISRRRSPRADSAGICSSASTASCSPFPLCASARTKSSPSHASYSSPWRRSSVAQPPTWTRGRSDEERKKTEPFVKGNAVWRQFYLWVKCAGGEKVPWFDCPTTPSEVPCETHST
jgi:hypothetical protein